MEGRAVVGPTTAPSPADHGPDVERIYRLYVDDVHRYIARRLGTSSAIDLTAETFRVALERYETYDAGRGHERAWLYGIASNLVRGHWRTEERRLRALQRDAAAPRSTVDPLLQVEQRLDARSQLSQVLSTVAELPAEDRDLLMLFAWERCSYSEIAVALGIPVGTVRSRLNRIRTGLNTDDEGKAD